MKQPIYDLSKDTNDKLREVMNHGKCYRETKPCGHDSPVRKCFYIYKTVKYFIIIPAH